TRGRAPTPRGRGCARRRTAVRSGSGRSLTEPLQRLRVTGQLLVEDLVEQFGATVVLHVLANRLAGHVLHGPGLPLRASPQCLGLLVRQSQSHRHSPDGINPDTASTTAAQWAAGRGTPNERSGQVRAGPGSRRGRCCPGILATPCGLRGLRPLFLICGNVLDYTLRRYCPPTSKKASLIWPS